METEGISRCSRGLSGSAWPWAEARAGLTEKSEPSAWRWIPWVQSSEDGPHGEWPSSWSWMLLPAAPRALGVTGNAVLLQPA